MMISMAHHMGWKVTAKGVENEEQLAFLSANQCDCVQGYALGKPMRFMEMSAWLQSRTLSNEIIDSVRHQVNADQHRQDLKCALDPYVSFHQCPVRASVTANQ